MLGGRFSWELLHLGWVPAINSLKPLMRYIEGDIIKNMNRTITGKYRMADPRNDDFVPGTPAERIALVWILTREIASLNKKYDVERRLHRHVTRLVRREG